MMENAPDWVTKAAINAPAVAIAAYALVIASDRPDEITASAIETTLTEMREDAADHAETESSHHEQVTAGLRNVQKSLDHADMQNEWQDDFLEGAHAGEYKRIPPKR